MDLFTRKLRPVDEMMRDPNFHLKVGRLIGAAEMAGHVLTQTEEYPAAVKNVGEQLAYVSDWFFVMEKVTSKGEKFSEADTRISSPRK